MEINKELSEEPKKELKTNAYKLINAILASEKDMQIFVNGGDNPGYTVIDGDLSYTVNTNSLGNRIIGCSCGKHIFHTVCPHTVKVALKYDLQLSESESHTRSTF